MDEYGGLDYHLLVLLSGFDAMFVSGGGFVVWHRATNWWMRGMIVQ